MVPSSPWPSLVGRGRRRGWFSSTAQRCYMGFILLHFFPSRLLPEGSPDSECPACSHRPGALCSVSEPPPCALSLGREVRQEGPPHHSVVVSSLLGLSDECWHKVIGFSSIGQHQTLSNCFRPTTRPRVDVVLGLPYAVFPDSLSLLRALG